ncbi:MAG: FMN-binding protein [Candidatus Aminicenantales bacterium]
MSLSSRMILVLTSVGLISGAFLAGVGVLTKERIALNKKREIEAAIIKVVPGAVQNRKLYEEEDLTVYAGEDPSGEILGYAVHATGVGFQDKITLMFGVDAAIAKIRALTILEQRETPGLGAKITDRDVFLRFWEDRDASGALTLRKPPAASPEDLAPNEINTITGATISSTKVLDIVNLSLERLRALQKEGHLVGGEDVN